MSHCASLLLLLAAIPAADAARKVAVLCDPQPSIPLQTACERLSEHVRGSPEAGEIRVTRLQTRDSRLGDEGYCIRSTNKTIAIQANTEAGLANGVYALLRTMLIEDLPTPWARSWDLRDKPALRWRSMMVAPYSFGGAHGFSVFSPDQWAFKHWQQ
jgi:hypothetical protein